MTILLRVFEGLKKKIDHETQTFVIEINGEKPPWFHLEGFDDCLQSAWQL